MKKYPYGAVFRVERGQSMSYIKNQFDHMKKIGMTTVVVWPAVYWWEDKTKSGYPFNTGRAILDYAAEIDIKIIMEVEGQQTSMEYAPDFIMKEEYFPVKANGEREWRDQGYGFLNYFHPEVKSLMRKQFVQIAHAYKGHPALYGYDIFNETQFASFDRFTLQAFRDWLEKKYKTIEALNESWERLYYDWSQIEFTKWTWLSVMPVVDYKQFYKASIGIILREWQEIFHEIDPSVPCIADNLYSMFKFDGSTFRPQDEWDVADSVDEFGMSFYPKNTVPAIEPYKRSQMLRGFHSATRNRNEKGGFWVSELQTHFQSMFNPKTYVHPKELRIWTWETVATGAKGVIYWKWHPFIRGLQTGGRGLVDYKGRPSLRTEIVKEIADVLNEDSDIFVSCAPAQPKVAILYDTLNYDFHRAFTEDLGHLPQTIYQDCVEGLYRCLWKKNIPANFIRTKDFEENNFPHKINEYKVIFISSQLNIGEAMASALLEFAKQGGVIIFDGKSGYIDDLGTLCTHIPCGMDGKLTGCDLVDIDYLCPDILFTRNNGSTLRIKNSYERQIMEVIGEETTVLGTFEDGAPAIIRTPHGKGEILYIPANLWYTYKDATDNDILEWVDELSERYDMKIFEASGGLNIQLMKSDDEWLLYAFNYGSRQAESEVRLPIDRPVGEIRELCSKNTITFDSKEGTLKLNAVVEPEQVSIYKISFITRKR